MLQFHAANGKTVGRKHTGTKFTTCSCNCNKSEEFVKS